MVFTIIVYTVIVGIIVLYGIAIQGYIKNKKKINLLFALILLIVFGVLEGCRFEVGSDWGEYKEYFISLATSPISDYEIWGRNIEPLFICFNIAVGLFTTSYQFFFGLIAIIQLLLYSIALSRIPKILGIGMLMYGLGFVLPSQNILRQTFSTTVFLLGITTLINRHYFKYLISSIIATFIHYSSIITLPLVFIGNKYFKWLDNKIVGLVGIVGSFYLGSIFTYIITQLLPLLTNDAKYLTSLSNLDIVHEYNSGLGRLFKILMSLLIVWNFNNIKEYVRDFDITIIYRVFLIGSILQNAFANSMYLARIPFALSQTFLFLYPLLFSYFWNKNTAFRLFSLVLIMIDILGFYMAIIGDASGCYPFNLKL